VPWLVEHARIRPGFRELVREHRPTVLSSGFEEMIRPVLARESIDVELVANRIERSEDGWRIRWRDETVCAHCDEACKRGALPAGDVAYVGDGYSDRCAALAATRVFARDGLADYLEREGVAFERWDDFFDVARALGGADVDERTTSRGLK
jgi:2-hydroxy-3-keto-5-methylthiopentenyl-1-phosphate phosphatase